MQELRLQNYRNYQELTVDFAPGINVLIGENAQGKTNLLEAIHVLAFTKSHRTAKDRELIAWGKSAATVSGVVKRHDSRLPLEVALSPSTKRVKVNHLFQKRLSAYVGHLNVVLFAPEDLALVKGSPVNRRQFMDMEFGQMSSRYLDAVSRFNHLLAQRNAYLRQLKFHQQSDRVLLAVLTDQVATVGATVIVTRQALIKRLEKWAQKLHQHISNAKEELRLAYVTQVDLNEAQDESAVVAALRERYRQSEQREIELGTSLVGPQRDDLHFLVNGQNVQRFGSQGQQRTTALAVKLAEIDLVKEQTGEFPLLLLDDVLSELDDQRQTRLLTAIQDRVQTFITTTSLSGVARQLINQPTIFTIQHGELSKEEA